MLHSIDPPQVSRGLNLHLELADPRTMPALLKEIEARRDRTRAALDLLHFVHFARFLPERDQSALLVVTEFDGPLDSYVLDFVIAIGDVFDAILRYVKNAPPLPVKEHPAEFLEFVRRNNTVFLAPGLAYPNPDYPVYSAYREMTVIDIVGRRRELPRRFEEARPAWVPLEDVQGNILHPFRALAARHVALRIDDPARGRELLGLLVDGNGAQVPRLTSAQEWQDKQHALPCYVNVGLTADGLRALGVPKAMRDQLPKVFAEGPADPDRAEKNGDVGGSTPAAWALGRPAEPVHLLVSLYAPSEPTRDAKLRQDSRDRLDQECERLLDWCRANGVAPVGEPWAATALPDKKVHFGYREGMAQPRIAGVHDRDVPEDRQPLASAGEFLLGNAYTDVYGGSSLGSMPAALCQNGTFAAVRVLRQDVDGFDRFLRQAAEREDVDPEWIAAKLMGRWRDGVPLPADPASAQEGRRKKGSEGTVDDNAFDYAPSHAHPKLDDDARGLICPVGAHARRMNPRSALVAGSPYTHRLIRRGMPYGPQWQEGQQGDEAERGLYGIFLCADLDRQFEFLLQEWAVGERGVNGRGTVDVFLGVTGASAEFCIPMEGRPPIALQVPRLVHTRGSLYLLMPGLQALRFLARGAGFEPADRGANLPDVFRFDPKAPAFIADPYKSYAKFREEAPVALVRHGKYRSYWVFSHRLVTQVCEDTGLFLKRPAGEPGPRGLFFMDPPRHGQVRPALDAMFHKAIASVADFAREEADAALADIRRAGGAFDLIPQYSNRVTRNVFMRMFGVPRSDWDKLGALIDTLLRFRDEMLPESLRRNAVKPGVELPLLFGGQRARCPVRSDYSELFSQMCDAAQQGKLQDPELIATAVHFALGGYLSTDFLVGTAVHSLLSDSAALKTFLGAGEQGRLAAIEELKRFDAPFQLADRYAARDTELAGCRIPAGSRVTVAYGSANHDEAVFGPDADVLDLARKQPPGANYVFGHGIHFCIGAPMADQVAPVVIATLLEAMPGLKLSQQAPERYQDPYFRGFRSLVVQA